MLGQLGDERNCFKGIVPRDFRFLVFFMDQFPRSPWVVAVLNIFENSRRYSQLKVHHRCRWHRWQMKKTYRYIFAFKFTLMSQQPDIVTIICQRCHCYRWQIAAGIVDTSETGGKICRLCHWYQWCTLTCEYLREFSKIFETVLMGILWVWGETDSWK